MHFLPVLMSSMDPFLAVSSKSGVGVRNNSEFDEDDDLREYLRTARQEHRRNTDFSQVGTGVQSNPQFNEWLNPGIGSIFDWSHLGSRNH